MAGDCSQYEFHTIKYSTCIIILTHAIIHASHTDITVFQCVRACTAVYVPYNKENNWLFFYYRAM